MSHGVRRRTQSAPGCSCTPVGCTQAASQRRRLHASRRSNDKHRRFRRRSTAAVLCRAAGPRCSPRVACIRDVALQRQAHSRHLGLGYNSLHRLSQLQGRQRAGGQGVVGQLGRRAGYRRWARPMAWVQRTQGTRRLARVQEKATDTLVARAPPPDRCHHPNSPCAACEAPQRPRLLQRLSLQALPAIPHSRHARAHRCGLLGHNIARLGSRVAGRLNRHHDLRFRGRASRTAPELEPRCAAAGGSSQLAPAKCICWPGQVRLKGKATRTGTIG